MKSDSAHTGVTKITPHPKSRQIINILQITDTHLFAKSDGCLLGLNTEQSLKAIIADIRVRQFPADLILATGDLVHDGTSAAYQRIFGHLEEFGLPVYCLPGNHDEAEMLQRSIRGDLLHYTTHLQKGNWNLIFLDSSIPDSEGGHLGTAALATLDTQLQATPDHHALVCLHHQPVPMGSRWLDTMAVDNADEFFGIIDRHPQVRGILWGHVHQEFDGMHRNIRLLASPSTCIQFLPGSSNFAVAAAAPGYRWLSLYPDGRIETGILRLSEVPGSLDLASAGYK
jgi:Icc protein